MLSLATLALIGFLSEEINVKFFDFRNHYSPALTVALLSGFTLSVAFSVWLLLLRINGKLHRSKISRPTTEHIGR